MPKNTKSILLSRESIIFIIVFLCSAFFSEISYQTSNYSSRLFLTMSIVDNRSFTVESYYQNYYGADRSFFEGHYYSDKPPGSSLLMVPQYLLLGKPLKSILHKANINFLEQNETLNIVVGWIVQIFSLSFYTAIAFIALYRIFGLLALGSENRRLFLSLISFFGTLMFPYSTIGTGEMYTVPLIVWGVYFLLKADTERDFLYSGLCLAMSCLTTYQSVFVAFASFMFVIGTQKQLRPKILFTLPVALSLSLILLYNWICFDNPLSFPTKYWAPGNPPTISFEFPTLEKLVNMLFLPWKGIFFYSPFLIFSISGYWKLSKTRSTRIVFYLVSCFLLYFLFLAVNVGWYGGTEFGFRYITPVLPFLCIGAAAWMSHRRLNIIEILFIALSVFVCSAGAITDTHVMYGLKMPLLDYTLPYFKLNATNNVINHFLSRVFELDIWFLRLATTVLFFSGIGFILSKYRNYWGKEIFDS